MSSTRNAGADLRDALHELGTWAVRWRFPRPDDDQLDPHLLLWRMRTGLAHDRLPDSRVVIEFRFDSPRKPEYGWLVLDGDNSSVCLRNPMFDVDLYASASSQVWHEIWHGHRSMRASIGTGDVVLSGEKSFVAQFAEWFTLNHFAGEVATQRPLETH